MTAEADVIRLLQRADWTQLSLAAEVNDGSRLLVAPGRRYRLQTPEGTLGCDGARPWRVPEPEEDLDDHWVDTPAPPLPRLFCPAWLLRSSRLEVQGRVTACGRAALHVVAAPRASIAERPGLIPLRAGRTEALVDAELGILLRVAWLPPRDEADLEPPDVTELVSLDLDPASDPAQFAPPPGSVVAQTWSEALGHPVFKVIKTAAGLAAGGLGALIRYTPSSRAQPDPENPEPAMPADDPAPEMTPQGRPAGPELSDEVLLLLHDSGTAAFEATLHVWHDVPAMLAQVPEAARQTGFGGVGVLLNALAGRGAGVVHTVTAVRIGGPGRYQVDERHEGKDTPKTIACDGQRHWRVYQDRMTVGPAEPPPSEVADLADASWLLECRIAGGGLIMAGDRPAYRISAARGDLPWWFPMMFPAAVAVVDAELGIILSLTSYLGGKPVRRYELRDVTAAQAAGFRVNIPSGLRTEPDRRASARDADPRQAAVTPLKVAGAVAREAGKEAAKAARNLLRRLGPP